jgi:hypothetical protein
VSFQPGEFCALSALCAISPLGVERAWTAFQAAHDCVPSRLARARSYGGAKLSKTDLLLRGRLGALLLHAQPSQLALRPRLGRRNLEWEVQSISSV